MMGFGSAFCLFLVGGLGVFVSVHLHPTRKFVYVIMEVMNNYRKHGTHCH